MSNEMYILGHEGYKRYLWDRFNPPACFEDSDSAIVIKHNTDIGHAWGAMSRDIRIITGVNDKLVKDVENLRTANEFLRKKLSLRDNKVRELSEELKRIKA